ncbi:maestro heat-like repeat-containing protein family member 1, partial [Empidonax traillii]|uniref:maestro heat-like repeat-containing protein family member 1 n=1 Tax=Empidonax traillii TaxID=164674 RepID=UPI000FFD3647
MVPFLNSILGTMLPMLGMAKQDHMKSVFCYAPLQVLSLTWVGVSLSLPPQICAPADPAVPLSSKNHTEVLRCFTVLACSFPDRVLAFLLPKLESSNERTRVGTLLIMRQIINSAPSQMEIKKPFILSFMKLPLQDSNNKNTEKSLSQQEWEERLLQFLQDSLAAVPGDAWSCPLVTEMCRQLGSYNGFHLEKNFLYKCIGTTLGACASKELVQKQLQELLETARYQEEAEREGLASCFGICAISHLEETLAKLEDFVRSDVFKKSVGLFSIFKDRSDTEVEKIKSSLILCYGHVAVSAPRELILPRIEADILRNIFQYFHTKVLGIKVETKDLTLKLCLIRSLSMLSQAVSRGKGPPGFVFARKAELVAHMVEFIRAEPLETLRTRVRQRAMLTCTHLVPLEPPLSDPDRTELMDTCLASVLSLPPLEPPRDREEDGGDSLHTQ